MLVNFFKLFILFFDGKDILKDVWYGLWILLNFFVVLYLVIDGRFVFYDKMNIF